MAASARYQQRGSFQAADEAFQTSYCGCRSHYVPGQGLFVTHRCAYCGASKKAAARNGAGTTTLSSPPWASVAASTIQALSAKNGT